MTSPNPMKMAASMAATPMFCWLSTSSTMSMPSSTTRWAMIESTLNTTASTTAQASQVP